MEGLAGLVAGVGWASGVNLWLVLALLGVGGRFELFEVPEVLTRGDVIAVAVVLFVFDFVADKIPYVDNLWDVGHTVIRPVGAAMLGLVLSGDAEAWQQVAAGTGSGAVALAAHVAKATARAAINTSPEPGTNIAASLVEDSLVVAVIWFAVTNPLLALALVAVLLVAGVALTVALFGAARRGLQAWRERRRRTPG